MDNSADLLKKVLAERAAEEKAAVEERELAFLFEYKQRQIQLELYTEKAKLFPENETYQQRKLELGLRVAVLLEVERQKNLSKSALDEQRELPLTGGC